MVNGYGMMYDMYGTGTGFGITGFVLNLLIILIVIAVVIALLNRTNFVGGGSERLARMEKDLEDVKK
ncbi:MAG: hypothetical protein IBX40_07320, partial [Methanosarcinales archaeon]|nr:hypothetical protein [Methanosarcinales archaeon]